MAMGEIGETGGTLKLTRSGAGRGLRASPDGASPPIAPGPGQWEEANWKLARSRSSRRPDWAGPGFPGNGPTGPRSAAQWNECRRQSPGPSQSCSDQELIGQRVDNDPRGQKSPRDDSNGL